MNENESYGATPLPESEYNPLFTQLAEILNDVDAQLDSTATKTIEAEKSMQFQYEVVIMLWNRLVALAQRLVRLGGAQNLAFIQFELLRKAEAELLNWDENQDLNQPEEDSTTLLLVKKVDHFIEKREAVRKRMMEYASNIERYSITEHQLLLKELIVELQAIVEEEIEIRKATSQS